MRSLPSFSSSLSFGTVRMKFFIDRPMLKTEHYKRYISSFSLDKVIVGALYDAEMQKKIHRFKFVHNHVDHVYFKEIFSHMKAEFPYQPDIIVYPPISLRDRIFRGPNHARILAQYFSHDTQIFCPFSKKFFTTHQSRRTRKERYEIRHEYSLKISLQNFIRGKKIALIDDVITTGYTAHTL